MAIVGQVNDYMRMRRGEQPLTQGLTLPNNTSNIHSEISNVADAFRIAHERGIQVFPFDIIGLVRLYGIHVQNDLNMELDTSGCVYFDRQQGAWIISVNATQSDARKRFTIAHELAHIVLHGNLILSEGVHKDKSLFRDSDIYSAIEREANEFAGNILIPQQKLIELVQSGMKTSDELAIAFNVSQSAIKYRLNKCGLSWVK